MVFFLVFTNKTNWEAGVGFLLKFLFEIFIIIFKNVLFKKNYICDHVRDKIVCPLLDKFVHTAIGELYVYKY